MPKHTETVELTQEDLIEAIRMYLYTRYRPPVGTPIGFWDVSIQVHANLGEKNIFTARATRTSGKE